MASTASGPSQLQSPRQPLTSPVGYDANDLSPSSSSSAALPSAAPTIAPHRPKRTLAKRSCLQCRHKKARCELPDVTVPSTQEPVEYDKKCHRCRVLHVDCIVWDGDRKRKPRIAANQPSPLTLPYQQAHANRAQHQRDTPAPRKRPRSSASNDHPITHQQGFRSHVADPKEGSSTDGSSRRSDNFHRDASNRSAAEALASLYHSPASSTTTASTPRTAAQHGPSLFFRPESELFRGHPSTTSADIERPYTSPGCSTSASTVASNRLNNDNGSAPCAAQADRHHPRCGGQTANGRSDSFWYKATETTAQKSSDRPLQRSRTARLGCNGSGGATGECKDRGAANSQAMIWKPLTLMLEYASSQPQFLEYLMERVTVIDAPLRAIDVTDLLDQSLCDDLEPWLRPYIAWHPHLPSLTSTYLDHTRSANKSTSLLLATLALLAVRHQKPLSMDLPRRLSASIDRLGTHILVSTPRTIQTAIALELLVAHEPALVGVAAVGSAREQASRGGDLAGENLLAVALNVCRDLGIDKSLERYAAAVEELRAAHRLESSRTIPPAVAGRSTPLDPTHDGQPSAAAVAALIAIDESRYLELRHLLGAASLWLSLRMWEGHYVFIKPTIRPLRDLGPLAEQAKGLIGNDEFGRKIPMPAAGGGGGGVAPVSSSLRRAAIEDEPMLKAAGRTILAYRIQKMANFHDTIQVMQETLVVTTSNRDLGKGSNSSYGRKLEYRQTFRPPVSSPPSRSNQVAGGPSGAPGSASTSPARDGDRLGDAVDAEHRDAASLGAKQESDGGGGEAAPKESSRGWEDRATRTAMQIRIKELFFASYRTSDQTEREKHLAMAPFAAEGLGSLPEAWSRFESLALSSMLGVFGSCAMHNGRIQYAFSPHDFIASLVSDHTFNQHVAEVGKERQVILTKLLASFVMFDRPILLGEARDFHFGAAHAEGTVEATGIPIFLTSGLVVDACKSFVEGTACVIMAYTTLLDTTDTQVILMMQAAERLAALDRNCLYPAGSDSKRGSRDGSNPEQAPMELLSTSRIAAQYVRQMIEMLQRWSLADTLHRRVPQPLWVRMPSILQPPRQDAGAEGGGEEAEWGGVEGRGPSLERPPTTAPQPSSRPQAAIAHEHGYGQQNQGHLASTASPYGFDDNMSQSSHSPSHYQPPAPPAQQAYSQLQAHQLAHSQHQHQHQHYRQDYQYQPQYHNQHQHQHQAYHEQEQRTSFEVEYPTLTPYPSSAVHQQEHHHQQQPQQAAPPHSSLTQHQWPFLPSELNYGPGLQELDSFLEWALGGATHGHAGMAQAPHEQAPGQAPTRAHANTHNPTGAGGFDTLFDSVFPNYQR